MLLVSFLLWHLQTQLFMCSQMVWAQQLLPTTQHTSRCACMHASLVINFTAFVATFDATLSAPVINSALS